MARPKGARNAKPSKAAISGYYEMLQAAAGKGNVHAMSSLITASQRDALLVIEERDRLNRETQAAKETGDYSEHASAIKKKLFFELDQAELEQ